MPTLVCFPYFGLLFIYAYQKVASHLPYKILIETRPQNSRFIQKCTGERSFFINILLKQNEYWKILKLYGRH